MTKKKLPQTITPNDPPTFREKLAEMEDHYHKMIAQTQEMRDLVTSYQILDEPYNMFDLYKIMG